MLHICYHFPLNEIFYANNIDLALNQQLIRNIPSRPTLTENSLQKNIHLHKPIFLKSLCSTTHFVILSRYDPFVATPRQNSLRTVRCRVQNCKPGEAKIHFCRKTSMLETLIGNNPRPKEVGRSRGFRENNTRPSQSHAKTTCSLPSPNSQVACPAPRSVSKEAGYLVRAGGVSLLRASKKPAAARRRRHRHRQGRARAAEHTYPLHLEPRACSADRGRCGHDSARAS